MKKIAIVTENVYLMQKIRLALADVSEGSFSFVTDDFDICFWDIDTVGEAPQKSGIIKMSRTDLCDLKIPFSFDSLLSHVSNDKSKLSLDPSGRICTFRGEKIKLTELEGGLLGLLISANGDFVKREKILESLWGGNADIGIINVYIHYLREKIEDGEKIILSSRGEGYRIDKRFLGDL